MGSVLETFPLHSLVCFLICSAFQRSPPRLVAQKLEEKLQNYPAHASFSHFPMLPPELRLRIWQIAIVQSRLLEITVELPSDSRDTSLYLSRNALGNLVSSQNYLATVHGNRLYTKLLYINRESRQVALQFYRVHVPCHFQTFKDGIEGSIKTTLYFNPEYDFIQLKLPGLDYAFIDFVHDLKAYDPQNIGLLNLALGTNSMNHLHSLTTISDAAARAFFVAFLSRLQQLIWIAHSHAGRGIMGLLQGFQGVGFQFNHSIPVKAANPSFNLLNRDPRPVGPELKYVLTACYDPRRMRVQWKELLQRWQIHQVQPTQERVLFAYDPLTHEQQVYDIRTANKFLKEEEEKWLEAQNHRPGLVRKFAGKMPIESHAELAEAVRPAIGFWLFPVEAIGDLNGDISGMKKVYDMTGYWPELALSRLF
ncbi:hypothetical protein B0O99DRAFT_667896 [Bisporella sp. PMI_857]|nr:hypothetical protein B0O99DRAFT_667896 [Bisporella sp. PMI_857]